jgi:hypothetical protein
VNQPRNGGAQRASADAKLGRKRNLVRQQCATLIIRPANEFTQKLLRSRVKWRRLRCDYECFPVNSEAFIHIAMIGLMTRRLTRKK